MTGTALAPVPADWRKLDLAAKARLRWRLKARTKQLTPPEHALCEDPDLCKEIIESSWKLFPLKYMAPEREHYQLINGHVPWFIWLILAGRGWGKTRTGAEDIAKSMYERQIRVALVGPTFADGRDTMVEGESGLLSIIPKSLIDNWNRSIGELILKNGSRAKIFSAEEPQRLRGPQHHRAWCLLTGTPVRTPGGLRSIETLSVGDLVSTMAGPKAVVAVGSREADLWALRLSGGQVMYGSADHPVATLRGWVELSQVRSTDRLIAWCDETGRSARRATSTATKLDESSTSTGLSGKSTMGSRSLDTSTSIIETRIDQIIDLAISNCLVPNNIGQSIKDELSLSVLSAMRGIQHPQRKRELIFAQDALDLSRNYEDQSLNERALHAESSSTQHPIDHQDLSTTAVVGAATQVGLSGTVHNLTVEGEHHFFAEDVLTHNCDEIAAWRYIQATWDMLMFGLRLGREPKVIITTTPKPYRFVRRLVAQSTDRSQKVVLTTGSTFENKRNLPTVVINKLTETYEGTRLGRQELDAEVLEDLAGGIIKIADIDAMRLSIGDVRNTFPTADIKDLLDRIVVAIDPAVTSKATSDETGIVVCGRSTGPCPICSPLENPRRRSHAFVLEDVTSPHRVTEAEWSQLAVMAHRRWMADVMVGEVNNGGDLVEAVLRAVDATLPFSSVHASRGKVKRAEPIGALYERREVHHVGKFPKLEDQLCRLGIDPEDEEDGDPDDEDSSSPDRADAAVWALSELMIPEARMTTKTGQASDERGYSDR